MSSARVALIAAPWKSAHRPSLQLAVLHAWAQKTVPDVAVDEYHHYVEVAVALGFERYEAIAGLFRKSWGRVQLALPEAFYAALLFPGERARLAERIGAVYASSAEIATTLDRLEELGRALAARIAEQRYPLVGISSAFFQTFASLYIAQQVRAHDRDAVIVVGGPEVPGRVGTSLLRTFPDIDFTVACEGELIFEKMCIAARTLRGDALREAIRGIPGVLTKESGDDDEQLMPQGASARPPELQDLDALPVPDFTQYFGQLPRSMLHLVEMPVETNRGCWWDRSNLDAGKSCSFCNLNATWSAYREKSPAKVMRELETIEQRHGLKRFVIVDNVLRQGRGLEELLARLTASPSDRALTLEARASLKPREHVALKRAGAVDMQLGIEALSTGILRRLVRKGTTTLMNLAGMRWLDELSVTHAGNLILRYPGSTPEDVKETLHNLPFAAGLQPLIAGDFWLGYYSPIYRAPAELGLTNLRNNRPWRECLPRDLDDKVFTLVRDFDAATDPIVADLWDEVSIHLLDWRLHFTSVSRQHRVRSLVLCTDGVRGLVVTDLRGAAPATTVLCGPRREAYLRAMAPLKLERLVELLGEKESAAFLEEMLERRLLFSEDGRVVSLAVAERAEDEPFYLELLEEEASRRGGRRLRVIEHEPRGGAEE